MLHCNQFLLVYFSVLLFSEGFFSSYEEKEERWRLHVLPAL